MKLVLLSGGSGKRLWPLSNDSRSKQFLKVLKSSENHMESMIQRVWAQLGRAELSKDAYIATGRGQVEMIQSQISLDAPLIIEPARRDTFPAIALAVTYLYSVIGVSLEEVITLLPVDPYVEDAFFEKVKQLERVLDESEADMALIGVKPTYPSEKYGYIIPRDPIEGQEYRQVSHFTEKPHMDRAQELLKQGALWNCGVFSFRLGFMIQLLINKGIPIQYDELVKHYEQLPPISFDYEVLEKTPRTVVIPYEGYWKDLGTWNTLTEEIATNLIGKGTICPDSTDTHVINELDIPVVVLGLPNIIVSISPDGILVADKKASPFIKEHIQHFDQRPMYEERRWGSYSVLDFKKSTDGNEVLTKKVVISAGKNLSYQLHRRRCEVLTIISGTGEFILDEQGQKVQAGDVLLIPIGARHSIRAIEELEFIEVQIGSELIEEDVIRLCMAWEDIPYKVGV